MLSTTQQLQSDIEYSIDLQAIQNNIQTIRAHLGKNTRIMVMVKALAYGTDDERVAHFLESCDVDILGVATLEEGISLRERGNLRNIFVFNLLPSQAYEAVSKRLEVGVSSKELIQALGKASEQLNIITKLHLHIDTGMVRFGCLSEEALDLAVMIDRHPFLSLEGLMSHFSCADDPNQDQFSQKQIDQFCSILFILQSKKIQPKWIHIANSAGTARFSIPHCNMARVGLAIYGIENVKPNLPLQSALTLRTRLVGINHCKKGDVVSYQRAYRIQSEFAKIGILPIGYFDGLHRNYSNKIEVLIRGKRAPLVGAVCMDHSMIDISHVPGVQLEDPVTIFGSDEYGNTISPIDMAKRGGTIAHELITCLGPRVKRIFISPQEGQYALGSKGT